MITIGRQQILQVKDLPNNTFFAVAPYADAEEGDQRFRWWYVLIEDKDLPPHLRHGTDTDACFRISEFQARSGQSVLVWMRETDAFDDEDCVFVLPFEKLIKNGAEVCVLGEHERRPEEPPEPVFRIPATRKSRGGRGHTRGSRRTH
ncbi:MAG: hypothetical protein WC050_00210 [Candidatus Paceibacterota bacterium]